MQGAGEAVEQRGGVRLAARVPWCDRDHDPTRGEIKDLKNIATTLIWTKYKLKLAFSPSPVISDSVKEAVALVNHGGHRTQTCGVTHQTGRQHEVTSTPAEHKHKSNVLVEKQQTEQFFLKWSHVLQS